MRVCCLSVDAVAGGQGRRERAEGRIESTLHLPICRQSLQCVLLVHPVNPADCGWMQE